MKKAADRACTEMFLVKPFQNIPGFQQRLLGEDQQWADRARVEMQRARALIRSCRSADAGALLRACYVKEQFGYGVTIPANKGYQEEFCRRLMGPSPSARQAQEVLKRMRHQDGTHDLEAEMNLVCPDPECRCGTGYIHQVRHMSCCGNRLKRATDKGRLTGIHETVKRELCRIGQHATGYKASSEDTGQYLEGKDYRMDLVIHRGPGEKEILVDVTCVDPLAQAALAPIN